MQRQTDTHTSNSSEDNAVGSVVVRNEWLDVTSTDAPVRRYSMCEHEWTMKVSWKVTINREKKSKALDEWTTHTTEAVTATQQYMSLRTHILDVVIGSKNGSAKRWILECNCVQIIKHNLLGNMRDFLWKEKQIKWMGCASTKQKIQFKQINKNW